ncbi:RrF2 family transcriptional regulator [Micrococcus sp.]|uniref:RrF2 family transcriptional regulator n=1 Tax=Micrococcus sp. TaxID=1271 RepID=UPI002A909F7C|nr:Rrf2 family transcriptional regulator [Micrococcus sp.]MDY6055174.1 Rrf2 family transcriptional regulator [Micrococcus sp.]
MKLNAFTDVCLRALLLLGGDPERRRTTQQVADEIAVPYNHVVKAVAELRRRGLLEVTRGRTGGARVTQVGLDQRVGELVRALSTRTEVVDCQGHESGTPCPFRRDCAVRNALYAAREAFFAELDRHTVRELARTSTLGPVPLGVPSARKPSATLPTSTPEE